MRRRLFTFVSALAIGVLASGAARANQCRPIHTTITTHVVPCREGESPIGFCTAGAIHSGLLAGSTRFAAQTLEIVGGNMVYTGVLTVTTRSGDIVTLADRGILFTQGTAAGRYSELQQVLGRTGRFEHATGMLVSQGMQTLVDVDGMLIPGFQGSLIGAICGLEKGHHRKEAHDNDHGDEEHDDKGHDDG